MSKQVNAMVELPSRAHGPITPHTWGPQSEVCRRLFYSMFVLGQARGAIEEWDANPPHINMRLTKQRSTVRRNVGSELLTFS